MINQSKLTSAVKSSEDKSDWLGDCFTTNGKYLYRVPVQDGNNKTRP